MQTESTCSDRGGAAFPGISDSLFLEESFELRQSLFSIVSTRVLVARKMTRTKIVASIGAILVEDPLSARFATFVVGRRVVVRAIQAHMEIGAATIAAVTKAQGFARGDWNLGLARMALHAASLRQKQRNCQPKPVPRA